MRDCIKQADIVLDCSDHFATRFQVNRRMWIPLRRRCYLAPQFVSRARS